ncbi:MAG: hypothetical protein QOE96_1442 [Blastocatellia bacterium]|jgi:hypothetical protein|nr:hypothetical protein [Blastocatellia bacterium]
MLPRVVVFHFSLAPHFSEVITAPRRNYSGFNRFPWKTVSKALIYLTHYGNGSATLMRGKSATCRRRTFFFIRVFDPPRSETVQINGPRLGRSETCRASEWQSHCSGRIEVRQKPARSQVCRCRLNGFQTSERRVTPHSSEVLMRIL